MVGVSFHISVVLETMGTTVVPASIKLKYSVGFFIKTVYIVAFCCCEDLYFPSVTHVADTSHTSSLVVLEV